MVQDGEAVGLFCCRLDSFRDRWMRSMVIRSPLPHHGLDSSPLLSKFFLLSGISWLSVLSNNAKCLQGDERA